MCWLKWFRSSFAGKRSSLQLPLNAAPWNCSFLQLPTISYEPQRVCLVSWLNYLARRVHNLIRCFLFIILSTLLSPFSFTIYIILKIWKYFKRVRIFWKFPWNGTYCIHRNILKILKIPAYLKIWNIIIIRRGTSNNK